MSEDRTAPAKSKLELVIDLIDGYIWCTSGSDPEDDYSIRDEDDFDDFKEALSRLL